MGYALVNVNVVLETESCGVCGTHFAMPDTLMRAAKRDPSITFYCPMGHKIGYSKGEAERLREKLDEQVRETNRQLEARRIAELQTEEERKERAKVERKLKRLHRGVCTCCKRTFTNLAKHMKTQHPEVLK